ncbi:hypothetical protein PGIGA_G00096700 [Pangasianodon gigas]|uniref:Uncharacterized protein n=1 Tax=Pangasianodon gigas TaxID=30993 RepID=A0ACC5XFH2_PANGG|nr:hypothetical protein [Pangasianodon gigas]
MSIHSYMFYDLCFRGEKKGEQDRGISYILLSEGPFSGPQSSIITTEENKYSKAAPPFSAVSVLSGGAQYSGSAMPRA